jgi:hypothetical protein
MMIKMILQLISPPQRPDRSYPKDLAGLSPGVKWPWREADHSPPSRAEVKNGGAVSPLPIRLHGIVPNCLIN